MACFCGLDDLHAVVIGHRKVDPHLAAIGPRHLSTLARDRDAAHFLPGIGIDHQHFMAANGGQIGAARPATAQPRRCGILYTGSGSWPLP